MKKQIYLIITKSNETFETIDKDCIKWYENNGATIIKKNSFVIKNNARG